MPITATERTAYNESPEGRFLVAVVDALDALPMVAAEFPNRAQLRRNPTTERGKPNLLLLPLAERTDLAGEIGRRIVRYAADVLLVVPADDETRGLPWQLKVRDQIVRRFAGDLPENSFLTNGDCYATRVEYLSRFPASLRSQGWDGQALSITGLYRE